MRSTCHISRISVLSSWTWKRRSTCGTKCSNKEVQDKYLFVKVIDGLYNPTTFFSGSRGNPLRTSFRDEQGFTFSSTPFCIVLQRVMPDALEEGAGCQRWRQDNRKLAICRWQKSVACEKTELASCVGCLKKCEHYKVGRSMQRRPSWWSTTLRTSTLPSLWGEKLETVGSCNNWQTCNYWIMSDKGFKLQGSTDAEYRHRDGTKLTLS